MAKPPSPICLSYRSSFACISTSPTTVVRRRLAAKTIWRCVNKLFVVVVVVRSLMAVRSFLFAHMRVTADKMTKINCLRFEFIFIFILQHTVAATKERVSRAKRLENHVTFHLPFLPLTMCFISPGANLNLSMLLWGQPMMDQHQALAQ